jgi:hypothetical protein
MLWHSGNANGMPSYMAIMPKEKLGVVVMINTWGAPVLHGALASRIFDTLLGLSPRDWSGEALASSRRQEKPEPRARVTGTHPSVALDDYAGTYVDLVFGEMAVTRVGDHLVLQFAKGELADLSHWHYDIFDVRWRDPAVRVSYPTLAVFSLNEIGRPSRLEMQMNQVRVQAVR